MKHYLKYYKIVRRFAKDKYNLTYQELDLLLFIADEKYFNMKKFEEYRNVITATRNMLQRLIDKGLVNVIEWPFPKVKPRYKISFKGTRIVNIIYQMLDGKMLPSKYVKGLEDRGSASRLTQAYMIRMRKAIKEKRYYDVQEPNPDNE
jgi:DNA-binding HxlR family transcriptional regulator